MGSHPERHGALMRLVVASMKGGSGKSTVSFNLAVWLAYRVPVQLYELDPQGTLLDVCHDRQDLQIHPALTVATDLDKATDAVYQVMDCSYSELTGFRRALSVADAILMPVGPSQADIWSAQRFLEACRQWSAPPVRAFINRADTHHAIRESDEAEAMLAELTDLQPLGLRLGQRTAFRRSLSEAQAVFELDARSKASQELEKLAAALYPELRKRSAD